MAKLQECDPGDVALKSYFIGPQSENKDFFQKQIQLLLESWFQWRSSNYKIDGAGISQADQGSPQFQKSMERLQTNFKALISRFEREIPGYSPHYVGHMLSENTMPSILGHMLALLHNPNNVSHEASSVGLEIERESIAALAAMLGFSSEIPHCGHFTSGGTLANFEALSRAFKRQLHWIQSELNLKNSDQSNLQKSAHRGWKSNTERPSHFPSLVDIASRITERWKVQWKPRVIISESAHYSWEKIVSLMGLGAEALLRVPLQHDGRMNILALKELLKSEIKNGSTIVAVVSIAGSTELGSIDALDEVQELLDTWRVQENIHIWHHVDAAYGGFFACCPDHELTSLWHRTLKVGFRSVNSITLDPHKLGYVPYSAGAIIVRDPRDYFLFVPDAPYIDADAQWPGAQTIEGSRSATGCTAFWLSARAIGLDENGYGKLLMLTLKQKKYFEKQLFMDSRFQIIPGCHSNLSAFAIRDEGPNMKVSSNNLKVQQLMQRSLSGEFRYRVSTTRFNLERHSWLRSFLETKSFVIDSEYIQVLRLVFMNPFISSKEFRAVHIEEIVKELQSAI